MSNVDDIIWDHAWNILDEIWKSAYTRFSVTKKGIPKSMDFSEIPSEMCDKWFADLWYFNVSTWTPRDDDRAFPDTHYSNKLINVLEYNSYDIRDKMIKYLEEKYKSYEEDDDIEETA